MSDGSEFQVCGVDVSQGSVVTRLRCDGIVNEDFVAYLSMNLSVKRF